MTIVTKILLLMICVSLCAGGAILSVTEKTKEDPAKTKVVPVNNRAKQQAIWILI